MKALRLAALMQLAKGTGLQGATIPLAVHQANDTLDLGVDPQMVKTEKATLAALLLDDSGSMRDEYHRIPQVVNAFLDELTLAEPRNDVLVCVMTMFHGILVPFTRYQEVPRLRSGCYHPVGDYTPLLRQSLAMFELVIAKQAELIARGIPTRTMNLLLSDGGEGGDSSPISIDLVTARVGDMLLPQRRNKIWGVAFGSEGRARDTFASMGIPGEFIKNAGDALELDAVFREFSRATSAVSA